MNIHYHPLPTDAVRTLQGGGRDFWGNLPDRAVSSGKGTPCRHCLRHVPEGQTYLIAAWRPFDEDQPYAEVGPLFICADRCEAPVSKGNIPEFLTNADYLLKGYTADQRIRYGTGAITATGQIAAKAQHVLSDPEVTFVDIRSSSNNCFLARITRA